MPVKPAGSTEEGIMQFFQNFPSIPYAIILLMGSYIIWQWNDRRISRNRIRAIELDVTKQKQGHLEEKNTTLNNYVHTLAQGMTEAVSQMKNITDELKGQIFKVKSDIKEDIKEQMHTCSLELRDDMKTLHKRVTDHSEELHKLRGEHDNNMATCLMHRKTLPDVIPSIDPRKDEGRRYYDEHPLFTDNEPHGGE
jgi:gas vesicle protein